MLQIETVNSLAQVEATEWNAMVDDDYPFLRHEFLHGLEQHCCLNAHGWTPIHLLAREQDRLVAAMPLYLKNNSHGEFVFDWNWADAYRRGIFPWYSDGQPILWWSPDPRTVLAPNEVRISRSLRRALKQNRFTVTHDRDFPGVLAACAGARRDGGGTWITNDMAQAYLNLHRKGHAHSIECWQDGELVGGLYGVAAGLVFFGESMFSRRTDASKVALVHLCQRLRDWGYVLIDCQVYTAHLESLGAYSIPRKSFANMLENACTVPPLAQAWTESGKKP